MHLTFQETLAGSDLPSTLSSSLLFAVNRDLLDMSTAALENLWKKKEVSFS